MASWPLCATAYPIKPEATCPKVTGLFHHHQLGIVISPRFWGEIKPRHPPLTKSVTVFTDLRRLKLPPTNPRLIGADGFGHLRASQDARLRSSPLCYPSLSALP